MRKRGMGSFLAVVALLIPATLILAHAVQGQGTVKSQGSSTPDLSGIWKRSGRPPDNSRRYTKFELGLALPTNGLVMTPWAAAKFKAAKPNVGPSPVPLNESNDPSLKCLPSGVPRIYLERGEPFEIVQAPGRVVMLFEYDHFVRQIYADGRKHSPDVNPTWMGESIGKWEGNTLVVDTIGFNDQTWLDYLGHPHTEDLHVVERIQRLNHDTLAVDLTVEDPKAYTKPWGGRMLFDLKPDWTLGEMICEDNGNFQDIQKRTESGK
jgi:hypothetical protein